MGRKPLYVPAKCHPDRVHKARGFCSVCYDRDWDRRNPGRSRERQRLWRKRNPEKVYRYYKTWIEKSPENRFRNNVHFPITYAEYNSLLESQGWKCKICGRDLTSKNKSLDHDHKTGRHRGMLCRSCNRMLGWFEARASVILRYLGLALK